MISQKQLEANRRNAQSSTGPRTPEGRAAVRSNALRHGLTAQTAVLDDENPEHFQEMLEAFQAEHQPVGPTEHLLVHQIVMAAWRLQRLRAIETAMFNMRMRTVKLEKEPDHKGLTETERQAYVFHEDTSNFGAIDKLSRYETRIERSFYKALHELQRLQSTRPPETAPPVELPDSANQTHLVGQAFTPVHSPLGPNMPPAVMPVHLSPALPSLNLPAFPEPFPTKPDTASPTPAAE